MVKAVVKCKKCNGKVLAEFESASAEAMLLYELPSILLACHAAPPHCAHELAFEIDLGSKVLEGEKPLTIKCLFPTCAKSNKIMHTTCPPELVTTIALVFHTAHEGHPMEVVYDGRVWTSPLPPSAKRG